MDDHSLKRVKEGVFSFKIRFDEENKISLGFLKELERLNFIEPNLSLEKDKPVMTMLTRSRIKEEGLAVILEEISKSQRFFNKISVI